MTEIVFLFLGDCRSMNIKALFMVNSLLTSR